jgi:electron transport complex protein RnfG
MNKTAKMIIVLTIITGLSGGILSSWDNITKPKIEYHRLQALKAAISEVLPEYDYYDELEAEGTTLYVGRIEDQAEPVGIAFTTQGSGFQGVISMMVGVDPSFTAITGLKVLEQVETPGLGTKIVTDPSNKANPLWFPEQFIGVFLIPEITVVKNIKPSTKNEIQAISGATITSKAVVQIINNNIEFYKNIYAANN